MKSVGYVSKFHRLMIVSIAALVAATGIAGGVSTSAYANTSGTNLYAATSANDFLAYSRIIRLEHGGTANGTLLGTFEHADKGGAATSFVIQKSVNNGATWSTVSTLKDPLSGTGHPSSQMWQPFLFEFPQALGSYPAGTLLLVGNIAPANNASTTFVEWRSTDGGTTWTYVSAFQTGGGEGTGIWEPFLGLDSGGHLNCYFSDERQSGTYSQKLVHIVSTDGGVTWSANADGSTRVSPGEVSDVASTTQSDRPGMASIAVTGAGLYVMAYEVCGPAYNCVARYKTSSDGNAWGSGPTDLGVTATTSDGRQLFHSPYIVWSPAGGTNGELLLAGQTESGGSEGGQVIFVNTTKGSGSWSWIPAPVTTTGSSANCSVNYSPDLLVSDSGLTVRYTTPSAVGSYGCAEVTGEGSVGVLPFASTFAGSDSGWIGYNGCWSVSGGVYSDTCSSGNGPKAVAGSTAWTDYTLQGDVRVDSGTQAGFLVRLTNPSAGTDSLNGYYVGATADGLVLGRESNGWTGLTSAALPGGFAVGTWYHLVVQVVGCTLTVSGAPVASTATPASFTYTDKGCSQTAGAIGIRDQGSNASWRNITVTPGGTTSTGTLPLASMFASTSVSDWTPYGGTWTVNTSTGTYADTAGGAGDKSVQNRVWGDATLTGDVELNTLGDNANAGFLVRVSSPAVGADSLNGYYAGVTPTSLVLGREMNNWTALTSAPLPVSLTANTWYHLTVETVGCTITLTGEPSNGGSIVSTSAIDSGCTQKTGTIGVRTFNANATWRNIAVTPR